MNNQEKLTPENTQQTNRESEKSHQQSNKELERQERQNGDDQKNESELSDIS